ncbi:Hypothetical protein D9617_7g032160 [Elsinoe fawcettii]|nr:Hypothetical protein D9617_7g032160 [Elsinoe fawcettii]
MVSTILIAGATGNTGRGVVDLLPKLLQESQAFKDHRVLALTRSKDSAVAKQIAKLHNVEVVEQDWTEITPAWLLQENVVRAFIAPHAEPTQFADESTFYRSALDAGMTYIVRISTTAANVRPDCRAYHARAHWAIEIMLGTPAYAALQWTSLQPNGFFSLVLSGVAKHIKEYRKTGKHSTFSTVLTESAPIGAIEPLEVGAFAAHLLAMEDISAHNGKKYVLNGPEDISGRQLLQLIEHHVGSKPQDVKFADISFVEHMASQATGSKTVIRTIKHAFDSVYEGLCKAETTSKEVLEIAAPKRTAREALEELLQV